MVSWCLSFITFHNMQRMISVYVDRLLWFGEKLFDIILLFSQAILQFPFKIVFEIVNLFLLVEYLGLWAISEFILCRLLKIHILYGPIMLRLLFMLHIVYYIHFMTNYDAWKTSDPVVAFYTFLNTLIVLQFSASLYWAQLWKLVWSVVTAVDLYGLKRNAICYLSMVLSACLITFLAFFALSLLWNTMKEEVVGRLENNVLEVEEDRLFYTETMQHPITKGISDPILFNKVHRYTMEDVEMKCNGKMRHLADGRPGSDFVSWRHNGVPIELTDRHRHDSTFKEIPENETLNHSLLHQAGVSEYEFNATLTILLLRPKDFGSYTCHVAKHLTWPSADFVKNSEKLRSFTSKNSKSKENSQFQEVHQTAQSFDSFHSEQQKRYSETRDKDLDTKRLFMDMFTWKEEFRLIRLKHKQDVIRSSPGSILSFTHSYWHVTSDDLEVEVDYTVNGQPFHELCSDSLHGCSKLLMLYWFWGHERGLKFGLPPLQLFTIWKRDDLEIRANRFHLIHCMCENAYGLHRVRYIRRYYNKTMGREVIVEILHPHTLLVVPLDKNMLDVFANRSECVPVVQKSPCDQTAPACLRGWDIGFIKEFASMAVRDFGWTEWVYLNVMSFFTFLLVCNASWILNCVGCQIKRLTLQGSMSFYRTAIAGCQKNIPPQLRVRKQKNDLYLSYSDAQEDQKKVHEEILPFLENRLGLKVRARNRGNDIPVNKSEILGITKAIKNSERVVVFLSDSYLKDAFLVDIEVPMIVDCFCDRDSGGSQDVLVVKLDSCVTPLWVSPFQVHDWTSASLTVQDHMLKLMRWLEPRQQRSVFRSALDLTVTLIPFAVIAVITFITFISYFLF